MWERKSRKAIDRRIVNRFINAGKVSRKEFREKWQQIFDEMTRFRPDLVIVSAGKSYNDIFSRVHDK